MSRFTVGNPWLSIWVKPRQTIREIVAYNPSFRLGALSVIYGLPMMLYFAQGASMAQNLPLPAILIISLILSALIGYIGINIGALLLQWTGKWIGGMGSFKQIRGSVAWSNATNIVNCLIWGVLIATFKNEVFIADFPLTPVEGGYLYLMNAVFVVQLIVSIWSLIIFLHTLGEVQGFSAWKALLNTVLPLLLIFVALWVIGFVMNHIGSSAGA